MAKELLAATAYPDVTAYFHVWSPAGEIWNGTAFEAYATANIANYDVAATEAGTSSGVFTGDLAGATIGAATGGGAGTYTYYLRRQLGAGPAETDPIIAAGGTKVNNGSAWVDYTLLRGWAGTALPAAAADAAGGLIISDAGGLDADAQRSDVAAILVDTGTTLQGELDGIQADTEDIQTRLPAALVGGRIDATVDGTGLEAGAAAVIADAVWDEAMADHLTAGTTGASLNGAGSAGDPWTTALPGAYGAGTAGFLVGTYLDAAVSAVEADTQDIQARLPAALTGAGNIKADVLAISDDATAANNLETMLDGTGGQTLSLANLAISADLTVGDDFTVTGDVVLGTLGVTGAFIVTGGTTFSNASGDGFTCTGGGGGDGIHASGDESGMHLICSGGTNGPGLKVQGLGSGAGVLATGGASGNGATFAGGSSTGHGLQCTTVGSNELDANIVGTLTGNITGNLSGSVGSVTGAVGSVTGNVGGNVAGSVASVTGAVGSVTGNVGGNVVGSVASVTAGVTVTTNNDKTGYSVAATGLDLVVPADPSAIPVLGTDSVVTWIGYFGAWTVNEVNSTATTVALRNSADNADMATHTISDDGTTFSSSEPA